ncbi:MAG: SRPBCC family protein [Sphingobacteriales bacterium]
MESNSTTENKIRIERIFDANAELVWRAWTEPDLIKLWFGSDPDGMVESAAIDLRVGGSYEITFKDSDLSKHTCRGIFLEINENINLVYSWEWESEPGHISEVSVNFHSLGEKTNVLFEHKNLNPASRHAYTDGWNGAFNKIDKILPTLKN